MPKIHIVTKEDAVYDVHRKRQTLPDRANAAAADGNEQGESDIGRIDMRMYFPGSVDELQFFEVTKYPPCTGTDPHAHETDEVMYVLEGELIVGSRHFGPGSAIYVPANTLYGFGYGEQGVKYLNFRPTADDTYISKADFMARRAAGRVEASAESA